MIDKTESVFFMSVMLNNVAKSKVGLNTIMK